MNEQDERLLHDYLDDELPQSEREALEVRLGEDLVLRRELDALSEIVADLTSVPAAATVPTAVWEGIRERIATTPQESERVVIPIHEGPETADPGRRSMPKASRLAARSIVFSVPQLAAAAVVLIALTGALTWSLQGNGTATLASDVPGTPVGMVSSTGGDPVTQALFEDYETSADVLAQILDQGSSVLSGETMDVIRRSIAAIDQAVLEAREALEEDPGSPALNRILISNMKKKLELLRSTAAAIQAVA